MDKPDVDFIEGLSPAISIDQKSASRNPRSTVGTVTEVYDYLRLLYARIGKPHCPVCGRPVARQSPQQIVDRILAMEDGTRFLVLAPVVRGRKGEYGALLDDLAKQGFARVRVDGTTIELSERADLDLARYENHTIEVVVDRLIRRDDIRRRLTESLETALASGRGRGRDRRRRRRRVRAGGHHLQPAPGLHPLRHQLRGPLAPQLLLQLALRCLPGLHRPRHQVRGRSRTGRARPVQVAVRRGRWPRGPAPAASTSTGCSGPWPTSAASPWTPRGRTCPRRTADLVLYGTGDEQVHLKYRNRYGRQRSFHSTYEGIVNWLERRHTEADSDFLRDNLEGYLREVPCPECGGSAGSSPSRWR